MLGNDVIPSDSPRPGSCDVILYSSFHPSIHLLIFPSFHPFVHSSFHLFIHSPYTQSSHPSIHFQTPSSIHSFISPPKHHPYLHFTHFITPLPPQTPTAATCTKIATKKAHSKPRMGVILRDQYQAPISAAYLAPTMYPKPLCGCVCVCACVCGCVSVCVGVCVHV